MAVPLLEVKGLTKRFGGLVAVNDVSLTVEPGKIVSLIGPNGAGKTTTFSLITQIQKPTAGRTFFAGEEVTGRLPHQVAARGLVTTFQKTKIFKEVTVFEAVKIGTHCHTRVGLWDILTRSRRFREAEQAAAATTEHVLRYLGLYFVRDSMCKDLSYGEQRLLEIAVAMAAKPRLLLLDEPAAGLNPQESHHLMELIFGLRDQGVSLLLVEHDMKLVMSISDKVVVLNFGTKIAEGTPAEIRANPDVVRAYLGDEEP